MIKQSGIVLAVIGVLIAAFVLLSGGCKKRDVPYVIDEEEIRRFIAESNLGQQFFRKDSLLVSDTFRITSDPGALYKFIQDSAVRSDGDVAVANQYRKFPFDFLGGQSYRDAEVAITDRLYFRTIRMTPTDTTSSVSAVTMTRYGWFVKVGDDSHPYAGWLLYGFNGGVPFANMGVHPNFEIEAPMGYVVHGDIDSTAKITFTYLNIHDSIISDTSQYGYFILTDTTQFLKIAAGVTLQIRMENFPLQSNYMLLTAVKNDGLHTTSLPYDGYSYTYSLNVPTNAVSAWYLLVFHELRNGTSRRICVVPYRVWYTSTQ